MHETEFIRGPFVQPCGGGASLAARILRPGQALFAAENSRGQARRRMGPRASEGQEPAGHAADLALVRRSLRGDLGATREFCQRLACVPAMLRDRHRRMGRPLSTEELEDAQQETLAALWAKRDEYRGQASIETWAYRFVSNEMLKALERRRRSARARGDDEILEGHSAPAPEAPPLDGAVLHAALDRLGSPAADIIRARHFDDRSFDDIARSSRAPLSTIKARYYRGLCDLRRLIEPQWRKVAP